MGVGRTRSTAIAVLRAFPESAAAVAMLVASECEAHSMGRLRQTLEVLSTELGVLKSAGLQATAPALAGVWVA